MSEAFPLEAPRMLLRYGAMPREGEGGPMLICGMFTPSYGGLARRLVESLQALQLPHALFEVPTVHASISLKGTADLTYTKANFIWHVLAMARRPVLYLDVDCVVRRAPDLIHRLVAQQHDFGIFNWLAQDQNDAYVPMAVPQTNGSGAESARYYRHAYHVEFQSYEQLLCCGAVQLWGGTRAAADLLAAWLATIRANPGVPDDGCLDFTFNNPAGSWRAALRPGWLPKSYARYPWWIFDEPVIDHPDIPYQGAWGQIDDSQGRSNFYPERTAPRTAAPFIPRDCVIDARDGRIWQLKDDQLTATAQRWTQKLWPLPP